MQSIKRSANNNSTWLIAAILVSVVGLADATYLTITHYTRALVPCNFTHACEAVLTSKYATVLGVPVAAFGVVFYMVALIMLVHFLRHKTYHWSFLVWTGIGFGSTLYLFYIQAVVLQAFCQYCLLSALTSTLLFGLGLVLQLKSKSTNQTREHGKES